MSAPDDLGSTVAVEIGEAMKKGVAEVAAELDRRPLEARAGVDDGHRGRAGVNHLRQPVVVEVSVSLPASAAGAWADDDRRGYVVESAVHIPVDHAGEVIDRREPRARAGAARIGDNQVWTSVPVHVPDEHAMHAHGPLIDREERLSGELPPLDAARRIKEAHRAGMTCGARDDLRASVAIEVSDARDEPEPERLGLPEQPSVTSPGLEATRATDEQLEVAALVAIEVEEHEDIGAERPTRLDGGTVDGVCEQRAAQGSLGGRLGA